MGKLNIAHHKSYHPYRKDNIEKVKRDEEEARLQELKDEGRLMMADAEARMDKLRSRNKPSRNRRGSRSPSPAPGPLPEDVSIVAQTGHINFFNGMESAAASSSTASAAALEKKMKEKAAERGFAMAPDPKDLRPWYIREGAEDEVEEKPIKPYEVDSEESALRFKAQQKKKRESQRKTFHDPMTEVKAILEKRPHHFPPPRIPSSSRPPPKSLPNDAKAADPLVAAERVRAEALIMKKRREAQGSEIASSIGGDTPRSDRGYNNMYTREETLDAQRRRRGWK